MSNPAALREIRALLADGWSIDDCVTAYGTSRCDILRRLYPTPIGRVRTYDRKMNLRLDSETHDQVLAIAQRDSRNQADVLRELIEWGLEACV